MEKKRANAIRRFERRTRTLVRDLGTFLEEYDSARTSAALGYLDNAATELGQAAAVLEVRERRGEITRRPLFGEVKEIRAGINHIIECPDAPSHLRIHNLIPMMAKGAKVGDRVRLDYHVGPSRAFWMVSEILK